MHMQRDEQEKVTEAFCNPWLLEMEKEMAESNLRFERGTHPDMSATLTSLLEIDCEKLRTLHKKTRYPLPADGRGRKKGNLRET